MRVSKTNNIENMDLNKQIGLLKQALERTTNFDDEEEKINFILDVANEYKQLLLHEVGISKRVDTK